MEVRVATEHDVEGVTATLVAAFGADPLWSWAFPEDGLDAVWGLCVTSAMRYSSVRFADDYAAASVWIPPGGTELTAAEEASLGPLLEAQIGSAPPRFWSSSSAWSAPIPMRRRTTT